jgi:hypothetical protein
MVSTLYVRTPIDVWVDTQTTHRQLHSSHPDQKLRHAAHVSALHNVGDAHIALFSAPWWAKHA